jgi:signal transduction histidine kinase/ligand-binding sensor domain-containing protein
MFRFALPLLLSLASWGAHTRALDSLDHHRWTAADGGPSQVGALAQTRDGYLWLGTNDSLFRFDGLRFVRYAAPDGGALGIVASLLSVDDRLWVGLRAGGAAVISEGAIERHVPGKGMPGGAVYGLARDRDGGVWAAADDGLARFDGTRWQRMGAEAGFPGAHARAVLVDRDGVLWAANEQRLFYRLPGSPTFVDTGLALAWASQIAQAPDGAIWATERYAGTVHRVVRDRDGISTRTLPIGASSNGLLFDDAGALWVGTLGNGVHYTAEAGSVLADGAAPPVTLTAREGLSGNHVWPLIEDHEGNVWVGTNAGLDRFRPRVAMPARLPAAALNVALAAGTDGSLWAGASNRPAMRMVDGRVDTLDMPAPTTSAMRDDAGTVWMGGPSGIWRSRENRLVHVAALPAGAAPDSSVRAMARDAAGNLWVSINRLGLFVLRAGGWEAVPPPSASASQVMPVTASADADGRVWFGYRDNLLVMRDAAGEHRWGRADGLNIGHVTAIAHEGARTWVGGQRGAGVIEDGRFRSLALPDNGLFDNLYAIIPVRSGGIDAPDLWVHGKAGIFLLPASDVAQALARNAQPIRYRAQDVSSGLANDPYQVLPLPTGVRGGDGWLWFSTSNGVVRIDPHRPAPKATGPAATIEAITVDGERTDIVAGTAPLRLSAETARVMIDYTALSLAAPETLAFRYRLDGYDDAWQDAGKRREAVYTGLGPGEYRFRVLAYDGDGVPSAQEAVAAFSIPPVFYQRAWFLVPFGAALLGFLWLLYRRDLRRAADALRARLEARHQERERIARELHDTLLQGVQGVMLHFQAVANRLPDADPVRHGLEQALDRADLVLSEGRDRVRDLRSPADAATLEDRLRAVGDDFARGDDADFTLTVHGTPRRLRPPVQDEAYRIAHEAIANAFAHAAARHVRVDIDYGNDHFTLRIRDDGKGIDPTYLTPRGRPDHWGLRGMHERAREAGGALRIASRPGAGSEIRLDVPAAHAFRVLP